jgi:hypothetical protein
MKYPTKVFRSMAIALKELERFVRDGKQLENGKPIPNFGRALPREVWANWLICAVFNADAGDEAVVVSSDPTGGDGVLLNKVTGETWLTEHVIARVAPSSNAPVAETEIIKAIESKNDKGGAAYASGKTLVVFTNLPNGDKWHPNRVMQRLPAPLHFDAVWVISLQGVFDGEYLYGVVSLENEEHGALVYLVRINNDFTKWMVTRRQ